MQASEQEKKQKQQEKYNEYVKQVTPTHNLWANMAKAFVMGGAICVAGQVIFSGQYPGKALTKKENRK